MTELNFSKACDGSRESVSFFMLSFVIISINLMGAKESNLFIETFHC